MRDAATRRRSRFPRSSPSLHEPPLLPETELAARCADTNERRRPPVRQSLVLTFAVRLDNRQKPPGLRAQRRDRRQGTIPNADRPVERMDRDGERLEPIVGRMVLG